VRREPDNVLARNAARAAADPESGGPASLMTSLQSCTHPSQMKTPGPATSFLTWFRLLPQKEHLGCSLRSMERV
jgi:hypothetical protein